MRLKRPSRRKHCRSFFVLQVKEPTSLRQQWRITVARPPSTEVKVNSKLDPTRTSPSEPSSPSSISKIYAFPPQATRHRPEPHAASLAFAASTAQDSTIQHLALEAAIARRSSVDLLSKIPLLARLQRRPAILHKPTLQAVPEYNLVSCSTGDQHLLRSTVADWESPSYLHAM